MTKTELMETYTAEQLAGMVINLQSASEVKNDEIHKLKWHISSLEEENGRMQDKLDTYNDYLLPRATKEAREMIDNNHFSGVWIATWEQWNNREVKDMNISDIQKCQEEYEKLLQESPFQSTIERICRDITDQKNNAMAMEFTRIICDLLKRYGVHVRCTETKYGEKITTNSIEEQYGIVFDSMDFSQHDKEFTDKIKGLEEELEKRNREHTKTLWEYCDSVKKADYEKEVDRLKSEVEKYRKVFEDAKKERDCQIAECQKKIEELENHHKFSMMQIDDVLVEFLGVTHEVMDKPSDFEKVLQEVIDKSKTISDFLPTEPIKVADLLIDASKKRTNCMTGKEYDKYIFEKWQLKQIAEHLLIYCNHNGEAEE